MSAPWKATGAGNYTLEGAGFFVSYNPDCRGGLVGNVDAVIGLDQGEETALVLDGAYLILNGDHRAQYEERRHDLSLCVEYFKKHHDLIAPTSDVVGEKAI